MSESVAVSPSLENSKRYHPALVTLHWVIVVLVLVNLYLGLFIFRPALSARGGTSFRIPQILLAVHMAVGTTILVLLIVRFIIRLSSRKPAPADAGNRALNSLARLVHYALYAVLFALTVVGLIFALQTNRLQQAFFGGGREFAVPGGNFGGFPTPGPGTPFPSSGNQGNGPQGFGSQPGGNPGFQGNGFPGGVRRGAFGAAFVLLPIHFSLAIFLGVLIAIHLAAAIYHQFILKDHLLSRMGYGRS
jgi:cytochrome b561